MKECQNPIHAFFLRRPVSCENGSFGGNMEFEGNIIDLSKGYSLRF